MFHIEHSRTFTSPTMSLVLLASLIFCFSVDAVDRHPIILVPGDGGSQLHGRWNNSKPHFYCWANEPDYTRLWLNVMDALIPGLFECTRERLKLFYNSTTGATSNQPGHDIAALDWGNTSAIEYLDSSQLFYRATNYYGKLVNRAVNQWNYTRGIDIRGAPFDYRRAMNEPEQLWQGFSLKELIRETYANNGKKSVVIIAHSMGNLAAMEVLNQQTQEWKDKYVKKFISVSAPWGGAVKAPITMGSGYDLDHYGIFLPSEMRPLLRTFPSTALLFPIAPFWNSSEVIVTTPTRNYTINDYKQLFKDMCYEDGYDMLKRVSPHLKKLHATVPKMEMHCIYGTGLPTPERAVYSLNWENCELGLWESPEMGEGDGTVNVRSARGCEYWVGRQSEEIRMYSINNTNHIDILGDERFLKLIQDIALQ